MERSAAGVIYMWDSDINGMLESGVVPSKELTIMTADGVEAHRTSSKAIVFLKAESIDREVAAGLEDGLTGTYDAIRLTEMPRKEDVVAVILPPWMKDYARSLKKALPGVTVEQATMTPRYFKGILADFPETRLEVKEAKKELENMQEKKPEKKKHTGRGR